MGAGRPRRHPFVNRGRTPGAPGRTASANGSSCDGSAPAPSVRCHPLVEDHRALDLVEELSDRTTAANLPVEEVRGGDDNTAPVLQLPHPRVAPVGPPHDRLELVERRLQLLYREPAGL